MKHFISTLFCFLLLVSISSGNLYAQTAGLDQSVMLRATVQDSPPQIHLYWIATVNCQGFQISRKKKNDPNFTIIVSSLPGTKNDWLDVNVQPGIEYEYMVYRFGGAGLYGGPNGYGYISSGIRVEPNPSKGSIVLLVDSNLVRNSLTKNAIWQWKQDVAGEGWDVMEVEVAPADSVKFVKRKLINLYRSKPFRSIFILGKVPVPYSGNIAPDAHPEHKGAWPTDAYYADTLAWPDVSVNSSSASDPRNRNVPGDGKFDKSTSVRQIETGRVDMRNLPQFGLSEAALIKRYLTKNHLFRTGKIHIEDRAMHDDQATGLNFGATAWRGYSTLCRNGNIPYSQYATIGTGNFRVSCINHDFLWSGSWGPGSYTSVGTNQSIHFKTDSLRTVFTAFLGSYSGDWDSPGNNFLRCALANRGPVLTTCWSGRPFWYFHHMGMGESIGYSALLTQNNNVVYVASDYPNQIHITLLGDPTLKLHPLKRITNLQCATQSGVTRLSWKPSGDTVSGFHVFKKVAGSDKFFRISTDIVQDTTFQDMCSANGLTIYMVRPVRLETSYTGTYWNYGTGIMDTTLITNGQVINPDPLVKIRMPDSLPACPKNIEFQLQNISISQPHYFRWYRNGVLVDSSNVPYSSVFCPVPNIQLVCELVFTGGCYLNRIVRSDTLFLNMQFHPPFQATIQFQPNSVCKHLPSRFKASFLKQGATQIKRQWFLNGNLLQNEHSDSISVVLETESVLRFKINLQNSCGRPDSTEAVTNLSPIDTIRPELSYSLNKWDTCSADPPGFRFKVFASVFASHTWFKNDTIIIDTNFTPETNFINLYSNVRNGDQFRLRVIPKVACPTITSFFSPVYTALVYPSAMASITIQTLLEPACEGHPVSVSALAYLPGTSPLFQWFQNGILIQGETGLTLSLPEILTTDSLKVRMISNAPCLLNVNDTIFSPSKGFSTQPIVHPVVSLLSNQPSTGICEGLPIRFSAKGLFTGPDPVYSWFVNDTLRLTGSDTLFSVTHPVNQDSIRVEMQSNAPCANPTTATSNTFQTHIFPSPNMTIEINQNELSVPGNAGWAFQWMKNGLPLIGANDSVLLISDSGNYSVALLSPDNCTDTTNQVFALFTTLRNHRTSGFRVYPNPVSNLLQLETEGTYDRIEVVDALGRNLFQCSYPSENKLDVSSLPPGYYNLVIHLPDGIVRKSFVKTDR